MVGLYKATLQGASNCHVKCHYFNGYLYFSILCLFIMVTVLPSNCLLLYSHSLKIAAEYAGDLEGYYWIC